uniref:Uncharacterized protein n=1 Tax=Salmo trutta TaxID=8032 RepID=A0A673YWS5_SALTR
MTAHFKVSDNQQVNIHTKSMMTASFLQVRCRIQPTQLNKNYLDSIENVYSTDHMRRLMKQHYLYVLHRSLWMESEILLDIRYLKLTFKMDNERDSGSRIKPYGQRKGTTVHSKVILSKIANSHSAELEDGILSNYI